MPHELSLDDRALLADFENGAIAPAQFDHALHLRVAYGYLAQHDDDTAHARMRDALLAFLRRHGIDPAKYHETLTRAWILAVRHFMATSAPCASSGDFLAANPRLLDRAILRTHYSAEVLAGADARARFAEPDLSPIPRHGPAASP
jgi:hypothetical protein